MERDSILRRRRRALGLSQARLAELLGVDQATISRAESAPDPDPRYTFALEAIAAKIAGGEIASSRAA